MELYLELAILALSLVVLARAAMYAIDSIVKVAEVTGLAHFSIGALVIAVSTSLPELAVALFAVRTGNTGITLGDLLGSSVTNLALVTPVFLLASPVRRVETSTLRGMVPLLAVASASPALLLVIGTGTPWLGVLLMVAFLAYVYQVLSRAPPASRPRASRLALGRPLLLFGVSMTFVLVAADLVVTSIGGIAADTGLQGSVLGATLVAVGTSVPELSVDLLAVKRRLFDLAIGDIVGSCATNVTLILGLVLVLSPARVSISGLGDVIAFAAGLPVLAYLLLRGGHLSRTRVLALLAIYVVYVATTYGLMGVD